MNNEFTFLQLLPSIATFLAALIALFGVFYHTNSLQNQAERRIEEDKELKKLELSSASKIAVHELKLRKAEELLNELHNYNRYIVGIWRSMPYYQKTDYTEDDLTSYFEGVDIKYWDLQIIRSKIEILAKIYIPEIEHLFTTLEEHESYLFSVLTVTRASVRCAREPLKEPEQLEVFFNQLDDLITLVKSFEVEIKNVVDQTSKA